MTPVNTNKIVLVPVRTNIILFVGVKQGTATRKGGFSRACLKNKHF